MSSAGEYEDLLRRGPRLLGVPAIPLAALVVANLVPLFGVMLLGWDLRGVMLLYSAENLIVAVWAIVRMLVVGHVLALPMIVFFCYHFGMFMFVHLVFVLALTGGVWGSTGPPLDSTELDIGSPGSVGASAAAQVSWWALAALFVSHGVSFVRNFLGNGEWRQSSIGAEMARPYPRMVVMHIAIIFGGFVIALLGEPLGLLAVLVVLKIAVDAAAHVVEHRLAFRPRAGRDTQGRVKK